MWKQSIPVKHKIYLFPTDRNSGEEMIWGGGGRGGVETGHLTQDPVPSR